MKIVKDYDEMMKYHINQVDKLLITLTNKNTQESEDIQVFCCKGYNLDCDTSENSTLCFDCVSENIELGNKLNSKDWITTSLRLWCSVYSTEPNETSDATYVIPCKLDIKNLRVNRNFEDVVEIYFEVEGVC